MRTERHRIKWIFPSLFSVGWINGEPPRRRREEKLLAISPSSQIELKSMMHKNVTEKGEEKIASNEKRRGRKQLWIKFRFFSICIFFFSSEQPLNVEARRFFVEASWRGKKLLQSEWMLIKMPRRKQQRNKNHFNQTLVLERSNYSTFWSAVGGGNRFEINSVYSFIFS